MVSGYIVVFFFFKQKTAYEMRISDWSSDVCSSDLAKHWALRAATDEGMLIGISSGATLAAIDQKLAELPPGSRVLGFNYDTGEIGRASCRERVCQYV